MPQRETLTQLVQDLARHLLGEEAQLTRHLLLQQTAEELWQVSRAQVAAEDEPAFAF